MNATLTWGVKITQEKGNILPCSASNQFQDNIVYCSHLILSLIDVGDELLANISLPSCSSFGDFQFDVSDFKL